MSTKPIITTAVIALLCLPLALQAEGKKKAHITKDCDPTQFTVQRQEKVLWQGNSRQLFKQYPHGYAGFGNKPNRNVVHLSKVLQGLKGQPAKKIKLLLCMRKEPIEYLAANLLQGQPEVSLVQTNTGEVRIFERKKGQRQPKKRQKRVYKVLIE